MERIVKKSLITALYLFSLNVTQSRAQNTEQHSDTVFQVKGVLVDSLLQEKEPYATIRVVRPEAPQKVVRMAVTGLDGTFQLSLPAEGSYRISISSMGKRTLVRDFTCTASQKKIDLGTLYTSETAEVLKNTEVVAQKLLVKAEIDRLTYNVEDDPDAQTNTTLEMLRKVPLVTVDGEDNIQVNGSGSFKVHVNGKPNTLMSNNPKEVLRSLPASTIKRIEVITDPGAKYDAEGVGGILNIVTTDARMQGYNATLGVQARNTGLGVMLMSRHRRENLPLAETIPIPITIPQPDITPVSAKISPPKSSVICFRTERPSRMVPTSSEAWRPVMKLIP